LHDSFNSLLAFLRKRLPVILKAVTDSILRVGFVTESNEILGARTERALSMINIGRVFWLFRLNRSVIVRVVLVVEFLESGSALFR